MIAALYVASDGPYIGLDGVDPWDAQRDARLYAGPYPVVAHPPCSTWCQLAAVNRARYGHAIGSDGGCFEAALASVQRWGGVLEHPAYTIAWARFGLLRPSRFWQRAIDGTWTCEVSQSAYGHRARKRTWLYYVGDAPPAPLDWRDVDGSAWVGNNATADASGTSKPTLSPREAKASPPAFRDALLSLARGARRRAEAA